MSIFIVLSLSHSHLSCSHIQADLDRPPRRSSNYSYKLGTVNSVHIGSRVNPKKHHRDVIALLTQGPQPQKSSFSLAETLLEWLTSMHIHVPDNVLSCCYFHSKLRFNRICQPLTDGNVYCIWWPHKAHTHAIVAQVGLAGVTALIKWNTQ